jgi:hypothetical protein
VPSVSPFHQVKNCSRNFFIAVLVAFEPYGGARTGRQVRWIMRASS